MSTKVSNMKYEAKPEFRPDPFLHMPGRLLFREWSAARPIRKLQEEKEMKLTLGKNWDWLWNDPRPDGS
jgi:hypothetical protein